MIRSFFLAGLLLSLASSAVLAQDSIDLKIKDMDITNFPVVSIKVEIRRNGSLLKQFNESNFTILENGVGQQVESVICPGDSSTRLSIALLLDRSGSMRMLPNGRDDRDSTKIKAAKKATVVFLEHLDLRDEACIYSFASDDGLPPPLTRYRFFNVDQNFTHDTNVLKRALVPIAANGGTWIWRAMLRTIDSLRGRAGRPSMIVLTDGKSQNEEPQYTYQMVITAAQRYKIPVYIIGLGSDVDESKLRSIANSTGGKYFRSPDETTLEQIFRTLAEEIITDACVLRYTSTNPCLDGSRRLVEIDVRAPGGVYDEDSASFIVPKNLSPVTMSIGVSQEMPSRTRFRVPVLVGEFLAVNSPMSYAFTVQYDAGLMAFDGIVTDGTMSQGGIVNTAVLGTGQLRVSLTNQPPFFATGTLVELEFTTAGTPDSVVTSFALRDAALSQQCPTSVTTHDGSLTVLPCEAMYAIGNAETFVVKAGETLRLPVRIRPAVPALTKFVMNVGIRYVESDFDYIGVDSSRTMSEHASIEVTRAKDLIVLTLRGIAPDSTDRIVDILFYARPRTTSAVSRVDVFGSDIKTDCRVVAQSEIPTILINGECEQILVRRPVAQTITNHPNPFFQSARPGSQGNSLTRLRFAVLDDGSFVKVSVHDATGREVASPVASILPAGVFSYEFNASGLPAGTYFALLSTPRGTTVHPMLLLR